MLQPIRNDIFTYSSMQNKKQGQQCNNLLINKLLENRHANLQHIVLI